MWRRYPVEYVNKLHSALIHLTGGTDGVFNAGSIESAILSPEASYDGEDLYRTDLQKCCKLFHALVSNHGYQDGNKRIGVLMFLHALDDCGIDYKRVTKQFVEHAALMIASGKLPLEQLYKTLNDELKIDAVETDDNK